MAPPKISSAKWKSSPRGSGSTLIFPSARRRLDFVLEGGERAAAAGLLLVPAVAVGGLQDRLAVGHPGRIQEDVDVEAVLELGDGDLDVELAVAGEQVLVALGVAPGVEGD